MNEIYLAVENDLEIHKRESEFWLSRGVSSTRVSSMVEAIEIASKMKFRFKYIGINASNINYKPSLRLLRDVTNDPIFIATNNYTSLEQTQAYRLGADLFGQISDNPSDNYEAVMAKIDILEWRTSNPNPHADTITCKHVAISNSYRTVIVNDLKVDLTRIEFDILFTLVSNRGRVITFEQLYNQVWDSEFDKSVLKVIKSAVSRLQRKISDDNDTRIIENKWGVGYRSVV